MRSAWCVGTAVLLAACGGRREAAPAADSSKVTVVAPDTTPQAPSFRVLAQQSLAELDSPVTLGAWTRGHLGDVLDDHAPEFYQEGPFCAASMRRTRLPGGLVGVRRAFFYVIPPADYPVSLSDSAVSRERECTLGAIVVTVESPQTIDTLIPAIEHDARAHFQAGDSLANSATAPFSTLPDRWHTGNATLGFGRIDMRDPDAESAVPGPELIAAAGLLMLDTLKALRWGLGSTSAWSAWREGMERGLNESTRANDIGFVKTVEHAASDCAVNIDSLIREAERYLPRATDSAMTAHLHFLLAEAHAFRLTQDGADPSHRQAAIRHYRAAFAMDPLRRFPAGRSAFFQQWRLIAGLGLSGTQWFNECGD